ncbi:MAG: hypothetical protein ACREFK_16835 [Stellaceae bacterium]
MPNTIPLVPVLFLYCLSAGLALVLTKPSSGMRSVVVTLLIGFAMMAAFSLAVNWAVAKIAYEASWYYYQ